MLSTESVKRYRAYWNRDFYDRAVLYITVDKDGARSFPPPRDPEQQWSDIDYRMAAFEDGMAHTYYCADAYPQFWINLGPGVMAAMLGANYHYTSDTVWFGGSPEPMPWDAIQRLSLSSEYSMTRLVNEMTRRFCEDAHSRYVVGMTDIGGTMDVLASFRGTQTLLMDLYDEPEEVEKARDFLDSCWQETFSRVYSTIAKANGGSMTSWQPMWCEQRFYPLQCDFSAMISPETFRRFVLPSIRRQCDFLDHSVYHLDGPGEIRHLDTLLGVERLDGIQWVPGDGHGSCLEEEWLPLLQKIQRAGKNLVLLEDKVSVEKVLFALKHLSPKGLFISMRLNSLEEAEEVERKACEYART
jgi:5-methyltetrahydrofolate--homocysteine methyltransferase